MNRIIEIIRKLTLLFVCGGFGVFGIVFVVYSDGSTPSGNSDRLFGFFLIVAGVVAYKIINWVFGAKEDSE